jgi:uncharacterized protein
MNHTLNESTWADWSGKWARVFQEQAALAMRDADPGHGLDHVSRVVGNARQIGMLEHANPFILLPAAWLHDCVLVPKNSPERSKASRLAAAQTRIILQNVSYPEAYVEAIVHAIEAHSFSAAIDCKTIEAEVVQDADRLEALGAIGIARCLMTAGSLGQPLYHLDEPFPVTRVPDDRQQSIDHFFAKLLKLPATMKTKTGRAEAIERVRIMIAFLEQLSQEIGVPKQTVGEAIHICKNQTSR